MRHLESKHAPVPLTHAEQLAQEQTADQITHASMNDAHSSMGGIAFALTADGEAAVKHFSQGKSQYVQFVSFIQFVLLLVFDNRFRSLCSVLLYVKENP